jgi:TolB-like protein/Tfp pilus assembly protein PilF
MSLVAELKRRNVFRVAAAYLALAWVIVQITGAIVPALNLPVALVPIVTWIGVIGFPCVLIFSWVFELTPEGLKRESEIAREDSITHRTGKRLDMITIGLLVVAIGFVVVDRLMPRSVAPPPADSVGAGHARDSSIVDQDRGHGPLPQQENQQPQQAATTIPEKSVAVLPFVNNSEDKGNEYFADGVSEELLNLLARVPELHVAARTSSFAFKGKDVEIPEIAHRLNVAHVLEGSVRKSGDKVRITAQLIHAADGYHLWSQTWDRKLDDIFAVQDEIAAAVVAQLKVTLLGASPKVQETDPRAYALFLQARQLTLNGTAEGWDRAIVLYRQALEIDPRYARAWVGLAGIYINQSSQGLRALEEGLSLAREAVQKALELDPASGIAHAARARIAMLFDRDWAAAANDYGRALALDPANTDVIGSAATLLQYLGQNDQAIAMQRYQVAHDPVDATAHYNLGIVLVSAGKYDEAIESLRTSLALAPDGQATGYNLGVALLLKGDANGALAAIERESSEVWRAIAMPMVLFAQGRAAESDTALNELSAKMEREASFNIAYVHAFRGEADQAFAWLDKAVQYNDSGLAALTSEALLANIHDDPRWLPFLRARGMAPEQLAAIPFDVKPPQ